MATTLDPEILKALDLPPKNRALLAKRLLESLDQAQVSYEDLWLDEAERRHKAIVDGNAPTKPAKDVMRAARDRLSN